MLYTLYDGAGKGAPQQERQEITAGPLLGGAWQRLTGTALLNDLLLKNIYLLESLESWRRVFLPKFLDACDRL